MTEQEKFEYKTLKEQNTYLLTWFDYFEKMNYSEYNVNNFHSILCGRPVSKLVKLISEQEPITITIEKGEERGDLYLIARNLRSEWKILTPLLDRPSANMPFTSNQGANSQKMIDLWANILKMNIECWAKCYKFNATVIIDIPCLYKTYMWYYTYKNEIKIAHIHPYLKEFHPSDFDELRKQLLAEGYVIKVELFEEDV